MVGLDALICGSGHRTRVFLSCREPIMRTGSTFPKASVQSLGYLRLSSSRGPASAKGNSPAGLEVAGMWASGFRLDLFVGGQCHSACLLTDLLQLRPSFLRIRARSFSPNGRAEMQASSTHLQPRLLRIRAHSVLLRCHNTRDSQRARCTRLTCPVHKERHARSCLELRGRSRLTNFAWT